MGKSVLLKKMASGKIIKSSTLQKLLTFDSYLHKLLVDLMLDSQDFYENPMYKDEIEKYGFNKQNPISKDSIRFMSMYLRVVYLSKQTHFEPVVIFPSSTHLQTF